MLEVKFGDNLLVSEFESYERLYAFIYIILTKGGIPTLSAI